MKEECRRKNAELIATFSFSPPNCLPWVRRRAGTVVGSRCYGSERRMQSGDPTTEAEEPKLRNSILGSCGIRPSDKKGKAGRVWFFTPANLAKCTKG